MDDDRIHDRIEPDLLRQRRALRAAGRDPEAARVRDADDVEGYAQ